MKDSHVYFLAANAWFIAAYCMAGHQPGAIAGGWVCVFGVVLSSIAELKNKEPHHG